MENVAVVDLLLWMPDIGTFVTLFFSIVFEDAFMYFDEVWSHFITSEKKFDVF